MPHIRVPWHPQVAGLNPIVGLYCYVPLLVYAAMGTSSFVSVGPVALVSTTLHGMIAGVPDPATRLALASCLMFWGGVTSVVVSSTASATATAGHGAAPWPEPPEPDP